MTELALPDDYIEGAMRRGRQQRLAEEGLLCIGCGEEVEAGLDSDVFLVVGTGAGVKGKMRACEQCTTIVNLMVPRAAKRVGVSQLFKNWVDTARSTKAVT